jgi:dethiobiotin synthetase
MARYFVTSSGTEIGKTLVSAALCHQARARGLKVAAIKPVMSGFDPAQAGDSDAGVLLASLGRPADRAALDEIAPWRFAPAISPDMAAARAGTEIPFDALVAFSRRAMEGPLDLGLVEGAGGLMAPLGPRHTMLDWLAATGLPPLLVVGSYLGTISHTLTAVAVLRARGIEPAAIVVSESPVSPVPLAETAAAIQRFAGDVRILVVPRIGGDRPWERAADLSALL